MTWSWEVFQKLIVQSESAWRCRYPGFQKTLAADSGSALQDFMNLFNECLVIRSFSDAWFLFQVVLISKMNDHALCDNYRPISIFAIVYNIFTLMVKKRLLQSGLDKRLWRSQLGFRKPRSTYDAILVARIRIELACAQRRGRLCLVALD